ncbi:sensor histidine kinase [Panacagrimonas sp.]|uniref:sensor histidine kinase n=1 Tax=Panacagrimonas sp. TaxID=2480088 RepID=UPI003B518E5A
MDASLIGLALTMAAAWMQPDVAVLEDPDASRDIATVSQPGLIDAFEPVTAQPLNLGLSASAWWLRIKIPAAASSRLLSVPYSQNDELSLYRPEGEAWIESSAGDQQPYAHRHLLHATPLFEIPAGFSGVLYLRAVSSGSVLLPLELWDERAFWQQDRRAQLAYGFYYAFLLALALYNLFLWSVVRDRAYLYYVLYLFALVCFQGSYTGHGGWLLWPQSPAWANLATLVGLAGTLGFGAAFVANMVRTAGYCPRWHRALQGLMLAAVLTLPLLVLQYRAGMALLLLAVLISILVFPGAIISAYVAGARQARFLVIGLAAFLPGAALLVLRTLGLIPSNWWTEHAYQLGTLAEVMFLSFALADRINLLNAERDRATTALAEQRERSAQALLDTQDAERRRIAQDLHDGLGQQLLAVLGGLRGLPAEHTPPLESGLREAIQETRRVAANLYPSQLDRLGLREALEAMMATLFEPAGVDYTHEIDEIALDQRDALQVFRVAQEALSNALRHAAARHVSLRLQQRDDGYVLHIEDDGRGLPPPAQRRAGRGLTGMQDRALRLNATLRMEPRAGGGTRIELQAPLRHG